MRLNKRLNRLGKSLHQQKTLTDIDGALTAQCATDPKPLLSKNADTTFGVYKRQDGQLSMGNKVVQFNGNKKTLTVDDTEYKLTPCLEALIMLKHPQPTKFNSNDYQVDKSLVTQTKVKSFPNRAGTVRPHATWKWKHMLKKMVISGERIAEEGQSEDTDDADNVESYHDIASIGDIGESSDISSPGTHREPFYKKGNRVVYLPGDINRLTEKLVRNKLVHVLDALLRLKQLTCKEYADITMCLAASL